MMTMIPMRKGRNAAARLLVAGLAMTTMLTPVLVGGPAAAQQAGAQTYAIPAQPLSSALVAFGQTSGLQIFVDERIATGLRSSAVSGPLTQEAALTRLLSGTGLAYRFTNARTVSILAAPQGSEALPADAPLLGTIVVAGGAGAVYETAAPVAYISGESIERYRGASPADLFRGTPGVLSGEARNGSGSIDPNIRGMQGMGRVQTTVDGAENTLMVYQGYQGVSNRSYVDPDFISEIEITKGADVASFGNAGAIAMRTISADDIILPGKRMGIRLNYELGGNTSKPVTGRMSGYLFTNRPLEVGTYTESPTGMDRPSALTPTSRAASIVGALRGDNWDFLLGYVHRERGNYHAGTEGPAASPVYTGSQPYCLWGTCYPGQDYADYVTHDGLANYRAGEEVLNTELDTRSLLLKGGFTFGEGHRIQLSYNGFRGKAGDVMASRQGGVLSVGVQRPRGTETDLDSVVLRYGWNPEGSDLINLNASLYWTGLEQRNMGRGGNRNPVLVGLPADFLPGSQTDMMGAEISNTAELDTAFGAVKLEFGLSGRIEDTKPTPGTREVESWLDLRDARRSEASIFAKAEWQAADWLMVTGGLRYQKYWSEDRNTDPFLNRAPSHIYGVHLSHGGWSGSLGVAADVTPDLQVYATYASSLRMPNLYESASAFTFSINPDIEPERSRNWEIGANFTRGDLFAAGDSFRLKAGYFNWTVDNYLSRLVTVDLTAPLPLWIEIDNIHQARFSGLELAASYEHKGFALDFGANYYTDVSFCRTSATCSNVSLYGDYATNQVPPEYSLSLGMSQKFLDDSLTLGGRVTHVGSRAIKHGPSTAGGLSEFISLVNWKPHTLVDVFAEYQFNDRVTGRLRIENLTDAFYVDPLGLVTQPGPGRTVSLGISAKF